MLISALKNLFTNKPTFFQISLFIGPWRGEVFVFIGFFIQNSPKWKFFMAVCFYDPNKLMFPHTLLLWDHHNKEQNCMVQVFVTPENENCKV